MAADRSARDAIYRVLRSLRPAGVVAVSSEGEERRIALPKGKGRWERAADAIVSMASELARVELRDDADAVLRVIDIAEELEDQGELAEEPRRATLDPRDARELHLVRLVLDAQDRAVERQQAGSREAHELTLQTMRLMAERLQALEKQWSSVLRASYEATQAVAQAQHQASQAAEGRELDELATTVLRGVMPGGGGVPGMVPGMPKLDGSKH